MDPLCSQHSSYRNSVGSADRWALISTYRDASSPDESKVFPNPRPVLRRDCVELGRKAHAEHPPDAAGLVARYILPSSAVYNDAKKVQDAAAGGGGGGAH